MAPDTQRAAGILISAKGIAAYLVCHRQWRLAEHLGYGRESEVISARTSLERRERLSDCLMLAGGIMIALALLILIIGLAVG